MGIECPRRFQERRWISPVGNQVMISRLRDEYKVEKVNAPGDTRWISHTMPTVPHEITLPYPCHLVVEYKTLAQTGIDACRGFGVSYQRLQFPRVFRKALIVNICLNREYTLETEQASLALTSRI
jgi:hypothetical protein